MIVNSKNLGEFGDKFAKVLFADCFTLIPSVQIFNLPKFSIPNLFWVPKLPKFFNIRLLQ